MSYAFAWLLDIYHDTQRRSATRDLPVESQGDHASCLTNIGGQPYEGRIFSNIVVTESLGPMGGGVILPRVSPIELDNSDGAFATDPATPWQQTKVRLRRLNAVDATVVEVFSGIITDAVFATGRVTFTVGSLDEVALQRLIPRVIITTNTFSDAAVDVGRAIPVVFGENVPVRPPHVATSDTTDDDGADYIVSHEGNGTTVDRVLSDQDRDTSTLELWPTGSYTTSSTDYAGYRSLRIFLEPGSESTLRVYASRPGTSGTFSTLGNPANVIKNILTDSTWGLNEPARTTGAGEGGFEQAATDVEDAELDACIAGALAADGAQVKALDVLNELCELRGIRLRKRMQSDDSLKWEIRVDKEPAAATQWLGFADGQYNNIESIISYRTKPPLSQTAQQLILRYSSRGPGRRAGGANEAEYEIARTVHAIGRDEVKTTRWVRDFQSADRILYYWATTLAAAGEQLAVWANPETRDVEVGELVNVVVANPGILETMRVAAKETHLEKTRFTLWGYDASAYTFPGYQTAPTIAAPNTRLRRRGSGANLIPNPDFSQRPHPRELSITFDQVAHKWLGIPNTAPSPGSSFSVERGAALSVGGTFVTINPTGAAAWIFSDDFPIPAQSAPYIFSVYASSVTDFEMTVGWKTSALVDISDSTPAIISDPNDTNPAGYERRFVRVRSPSNAAYAYVLLRDGSTGSPIVLDAVQFELVDRRNFPSQWRVFQPWNAPNMINSIVRDGGSGASLDQILDSELFDFTGLNVAYVETTQQLLRTGSKAEVVVSIEQTLTGCTSFDVGYDLDPSTYDTWGKSLTTLTAGFVTNGNHHLVNDPVRMRANHKVRITFNGGNCTGGKIRVIVRAERLMAA